MSTLHKFIYKYSGNVFLGERYPQQEMTIQSKCEDLDAHELLSLFKSYMLSCGYAEKSFYDACESAADENNPYRKGGNRYEMGEVKRKEETFHSGATGAVGSTGNPNADWNPC
jgi:hypothetical protein